MSSRRGNAGNGPTASANATSASALRGGRHRAAHRVALELAGCGRCGLSRGHVRSGEDRLRAAGARPDRGRRRPAAGGDDLRFAERQGGAGRDPRGVRPGWQGAAGHDLGGGGARRRDDDLGADHRGVLERGAACEAAVGGAELLARSGPDVSVSERSFGEGERGDLVLSECRVCRIRFRRPGSIFEPADMARYLGDFARGGLINIAGGCCGNTPEHIAAIAKALEGQPPRN